MIMIKALYFNDTRFYFEKIQSLMKHYLLLAFLVFGLNASAQILDPVKWSTSVEKISDTEYDLVITANIEKSWHLYSQNVPEDGPIPTTFTFEDSQAYTLIGETTEDAGHVIDDPVFMMRIKFFEDQAVLKQRVKFTNKPEAIRGSVEFMVCDDSRCLPPNDEALVFNLTGKPLAEEANNAQVDNASINEFLYGLTAIDLLKSDDSCIDDVNNSAAKEEKSLWNIFGLGFFGGLLAL